jgi:beta-N-acetylhexosaminidase
MLKPLSKTQSDYIDEIINKMSIEEKAAQVLCPNIQHVQGNKLAEIMDKYPVGGVFFHPLPQDQYRSLVDIVAQHSKIPVTITGDLVEGAGSAIKGCSLFTWQMAMGAADSEILAETVGEATAREGRSYGVTWTFSPVVDLNRDKNNSMIYARAFGDNPKHVLRMSKAYIKGIQKDGLMAASAKHFPGDGCDDRDPHLSIPQYPCSRKEWENTYGHVWRGVINDGVMSIMSGHIALPFIDKGKPGLGYCPPASLSKKILLGFLRKELGFKGAIISDAYNMTGFAGILPVTKRAAHAIAAGNDMLLFSNVEGDFKSIMDGLKDKTLTEKRLTEAVRYVLELKMRVGLFDRFMSEKISDKEKAKHAACIKELSERSMTIIRNQNNLIPLNLKAGAKVLTITVVNDDLKMRGQVSSLEYIDATLKERGLEVTHMDNPMEMEINEALPKFDAVFFNIHMPPNYGTTKFNLRFFMTFTRSFWPNHDKVVFTSFCHPYKIYEMNYAPNMMIAYGNNKEAQEAVVKVWLGEAKALGKNPVELPGYFKRQVK